MAAWTYSDWVTYADSSAKLERLRLHVQEVSDALSGPSSYSTKGFSSTRDKFTTNQYLSGLRAELAQLEERVSGTRSTWIQARAGL